MDLLSAGAGAGGGRANAGLTQPGRARHRGRLARAGLPSTCARR